MRKKYNASFEKINIIKIQNQTQTGLKFSSRVQEPSSHLGKQKEGYVTLRIELRVRTNHKVYVNRDATCRCALDRLITILDTLPSCVAANPQQSTQFWRNESKLPVILPSALPHLKHFGSKWPDPAKQNTSTSQHARTKSTQERDSSASPNLYPNRSIQKQHTELQCWRQTRDILQQDH